MLEGVDRRGRASSREHQLRRRELGEGILELVVTQAADRGQQLVAELPADGRADLGDLLHRRQPVEPRHQAVAQRRWDRQRRQRPVQDIAVRLLLQEAGLQHGLGQLLHEQRHAVRLVDDLVEDLGGQPLASCDLLGQGGALAPAQAVQRVKP